MLPLLPCPGGPRKFILVQAARTCKGPVGTEPQSARPGQLVALSVGYCTVAWHHPGVDRRHSTHMETTRPASVLLHVTPVHPAQGLLPVQSLITELPFSKDPLNASSKLRSLGLSLTAVRTMQASGSSTKRAAPPLAMAGTAEEACSHVHPTPGLALPMLWLHGVVPLGAHVQASPVGTGNLQTMLIIPGGVLAVNQRTTGTPLLRLCKRGTCMHRG